MAVDATVITSSAARRGTRVVDLAAFTPALGQRPGRWRHSICQIDDKGRVRHGGLRALLTDHGHLSAVMTPEGWTLTPGCGTAWRADVDDRGRVLVPAGVRHQLALGDTVVVSVAADRSRVVIWPAARLDQLVGVAP